MSPCCGDALRAIENGEFYAFFQPFVVLRTGELAGFELLARWKHPERGWISPGEFIPIAEKEGWINALMCELLQQGFRAAANLPDSLLLAVNVAPVQLRDLNFGRQIQGTAESGGFSLNRLIVEITESSLFENVENARAIAADLKAMGCKLALDDFGMGYSSLTQLQSLPFDRLKVDRSFVAPMAEKRESRKIVAGVVGLGQSLGLDTVAEGVETQEQAEMLFWLGCDYGQGLLYGEPMPAERLATAVSAPRHPIPSGALSGAAGQVSCSTLDGLPAHQLAQLQAVYDSAPVGLAFLDRDLRYLSLNRRLADMNGHPMEKHLGRRVPEMIPELFPQVEQYMLRALAGESIPCVEITKPLSGPNAGKSILLSYEPARDEAGEVVGVSISISDVTELKRAEKARMESEEHYRYMMELLPQIPWIIDTEGRALDVSQRWLELTGMTDQQWRGLGWLDALHPDDRQPTLDAMARCLTTRESINLEFRVGRAGRDWIFLRARGSARLDADGNVVCWYGSMEVQGK